MTSDQTATDTTVLDVLQRFAADGWTTNFVAELNAAFRCTSCDSISPAAQSQAGAIHRVEGASDPADMQLVAGVTCPVCHVGGVMVLGYGPTASELDQAIIVALRDGDAIDPVANQPTTDD